ncbi:MAG: tetratricopeptide repeat protein [Leptolyngbyaceae cyanobacterium SL_7_1]|nr:tetratricopeptide repeat protein [Leptolyngbyaceae cyanobacterium SL_7_1]
MQLQGQLGQAIVAYRQALLLKPQYPDACNSLGSALKTLGKLEEAVNHFQRRSPSSQTTQKPITTWGWRGMSRDNFAPPPIATNRRSTSVLTTPKPTSTSACSCCNWAICVRGLGNMNGAGNAATSPPAPLTPPLGRAAI